MIRFTDKEAKRWLRSKRPNAVKEANKTKQEVPYVTAGESPAKKKATINGQSDEQYYGTDKHAPIPDVALRPAITEIIKKENGVVIVKCR